MLSCPRTPQPDDLPLIVKKKRDRHQWNRDEPQQRRRPIIAQLLIHLRLAHQNHPCERRGRIRLVAVDDVVQDAQDDDVDTRAEQCGCDDGHDPVHAAVARPTEPEEADGDEEGACARHPHPGFGDALVVVLGYSA